MFDHPSFDQHERLVCTHDVIDAGGIIGVGRQYPGGATAGSIAAGMHRIPVRLTEIFARSGATHRPTSELADEMARQLLAEAR